MTNSRALGVSFTAILTALAIACASPPPPRPRKVAAPPPKGAPAPAPVASAAQCEEPDDCIVSRGEPPHGKRWSCFGGVCFAESTMEPARAEAPAKKAKPTKPKAPKKGRK